MTGKKTICFICGAPRSGTTYLCNLLGNHQEVSVFPGECKLYFYWNYFQRHGNAHRFFNRDYLKTQEILNIKDFFYAVQMQEYRKKVYGVQKDFECSYVKFSNGDWRIGTVVSHLSLRELYKTLLSSLSNMDGKVVVFKCPVGNEIGAMELEKAFGVDDDYRAKFIHIKRDYATRYISAKMRRRRRGFVRSLNGKDFASAHAEVGMLSDTLAELNKLLLGSTTYMVTHYENLAEDPAGVMFYVDEFLGLKGRKEFEVDIEAEPRSTFGEPGSTLDRNRRYMKHTTQAERNIVSFVSGVKPRLAAEDFFLPLKYEHPLDYCRNRKWMLDNLRGGCENVKRKLYWQMMRKFDRGEEVTD